MPSFTSHQLLKPVVQAFLYSVAALIAIGGSFYIFVELADEVAEQEKFALDRMTADAVASIQTGWLDTAMAVITEIGSVAWLTTGSILLAAFIFFAYRRKWWRLLYFAVAMIGISILTKSLKLTFERQRPDVLQQHDGTGFSFPSGHSTGPVVFYGFIVYLVLRSSLPRAAKWLVNTALVLLTLLIGFSRVYLNVHYITDVIGGFSLGLCWLTVCLLVLEFSLWRKKRRA
ncbi:phosphatase PAP2 family protein [Salibacterium qingdaonense]|uniref:Undecaprenyl-diphosphatase n=1 Tax=Salibacterium qingdaonense TaxID=266892 RepID=A0A1I4LMU4_9BACI|nr:phosphatase PAP2 family protein [Salibacterium qingdaonense]SFL92133.1 undecaprenyl-diphosphatase [Salibacterium qingdaonense]